MTNGLTREQIITQLEAAFSPHKAKAKIHGLGEKLTLEVLSAKDGAHILGFQSSQVDEMKVQHYLDDVIHRLQSEVEDKVKGRSS